MSEKLYKTKISESAKPDQQKIEIRKAINELKTLKIETNIQLNELMQRSRKIDQVTIGTL